MAEALTEKEVAETLELVELKRTGVEYHGCSAMTGEGIWESVARLADLMEL